jgi:two-component system, chemotaxis family, sensor kinase CheA
LIPITIPTVDQRTQHEFLVDIEDLVEQLFAALEQLRRPEATGPQRRELLARIFRHVHSIKGVASMADFSAVGHLAHQTESLLDDARSGQVALEDRFFETLEVAANAISESLSAAAAGAEAAPASELIQSFHDLKTQDVFEELTLPDLPADLIDSINEREKQLLLEALRENENLYLVTADFGLAVFDKEFQALRAILAHQGAIISSLPSANPARPDRVVFRIICSSAMGTADLQSYVAAFPETTVASLQNTAATEKSRPEDGAASTAQASRDWSTLPPAGSVRIDIEELDRLISSAHELFGQTVAALDLVSDTLEDESRTELKNLDAQIRESLIALEERIIQLRMVPLDRVMQRAIRAGRVAAKVNDKVIEFVTVGGQLRVDKVVCDAVADPLLHLVRNAVDQGIESAAERTHAGKTATGTVRIEANSAGGRVRFLVSDDGRGIDPRVVSQAAVKLGIVEEGTILSNEKSLRLIFRRGFSTSAGVSSVSGRGVGLDIVESSIERAGGAVRVRTQVGHGTEFDIRLPVSLGVMRALVLRVGGYRYCLDSGLVIDRCELDRNLTDKDTISWRNEDVPIVDMGELLTHRTESGGAIQAIICELPAEDTDGRALVSQRQGVRVDSIDGTEEVLVRSLGRHSAMWPGVVGATELWDGTVALVLDLPLLLSLTRSR